MVEERLRELQSMATAITFDGAGDGDGDAAAQGGGDPNAALVGLLTMPSSAAAAAAVGELPGADAVSGADAELMDAARETRRSLEANRASGEWDLVSVLASLDRMHGHLRDRLDGAETNAGGGGEEEEKGENTDFRIADEAEVRCVEIQK